MGLTDSAVSSKTPDAQVVQMKQIGSVHVTLTDVKRIESLDEVSLESGDKRLQRQKVLLIPAPTQDPRDPLNLSLKHKILGLTCLTLFGAFSAAAEFILGAMLPVFALEYAGLDPKVMVKFAGFIGYLPKGETPMEVLAKLPNAPPIWHTYLLASMPVLIMGLANLAFVPLAIAVGRRPVILVTGVLAIVGAIWSGCSKSLNSHIFGRCLQALGAGTVESLIPFVVQDITFVHRRTTYLSSIYIAQGCVMFILGAIAPRVVVELSWRWFYFLTAAIAGFWLIGTFFFMPETRYHRSKDELKGIPRPAHEEINPARSPRTLACNLKFKSGSTDFAQGLQALSDCLRTFFYPHILAITMLNSALAATMFAATFTISTQLLAPPYSWKFYNLGFAVIPVVIGAAGVALTEIRVADAIVAYLNKRRGRRLPEHHLVNLILPVSAGLVGAVLYGVTGENPTAYHWTVFLSSLGFMAFAYLGANAVGAVYVLEALPQLAGPALVNIASFRCILAFIMAFEVSEMIVRMGYLKSLAIYATLVGVFAATLPFVFIFGPRWRKRWPGPDRSSVGAAAWHRVKV